MNFDGEPLRFFPTPYPDEIFYSVLCRHHARSGNPAFVSTAKETWGKKISVNLYLPQSLGAVANRIPRGAGLTAHYFAVHNTIYPFLKPLIPKERGQRVLRLLESDRQEAQLAYRLSGLESSRSQKWQFFRCCEGCWKEDIRKYGEAYWHRLHQLPGILVCPVHGTSTRNTTVFLSDTHVKFLLASPALISNEAVPAYSKGTAETLALLAEDAAWLLKNGSALPSSETMFALLDQLLRLKGYRSLGGGRTKTPVFHAALLEFYRAETLTALGIDDKTAVPWSQLIFHRTETCLTHRITLWRCAFWRDRQRIFTLTSMQRHIPMEKAPGHAGIMSAHTTCKM